MIVREVSARLSGSYAGRLGAFVVCVAILCVGGGCSEKKKTLAAIKDEFVRKDYSETMVRCEHALRNNVVDAEIYYYYGMSLLAVGRDYESFDRFSKAVGMDSALAAPIAEHLEEAAMESFRAGRKRETGERLRASADLAPGAEFGIFTYTLADAYFREKDFAGAARFYEVALAERPDTLAAEDAYCNLVESYLALEDSTAAVGALERQLAGFPRGQLAMQAEWKLVNLLYERARSEFERGNYETVNEIVTGLLGRTNNISLIQRARFVLGESYERTGDYGKAYEQYKAIIKEDRGASGRIVERARARIDAFRDAGLL
jgi:tetratricopeptide (TPR) repeat protein